MILLAFHSVFCGGVVYSTKVGLSAGKAFVVGSTVVAAVLPCVGFTPAFPGDGNVVIRQSLGFYPHLSIRPSVCPSVHAKIVHDVLLARLRACLLACSLACLCTCSLTCSLAHLLARSHGFSDSRRPSCPSVRLSASLSLSLCLSVCPAWSHHATNRLVAHTKTHNHPGLTNPQHPQTNPRKKTLDCEGNLSLIAAARSLVGGTQYCFRLCTDR